MLPDRRPKRRRRRSGTATDAMARRRQKAPGERQYQVLQDMFLPGTWGVPLGRSPQWIAAKRRVACWAVTRPEGLHWDRTYIHIVGVNGSNCESSGYYL